jgi:sterol desaturase/sphingolipid hydroxylase (fatty acid hydroxylase superfamily)
MYYLLSTGTIFSGFAFSLVNANRTGGDDRCQRLWCLAREGAPRHALGSSARKDRESSEVSFTKNLRTMLLSVGYREVVAQAFRDGLELSTGTVVMTFILELLSLPTVRAVLKARDGKSLYLSAVFFNFLNHYLYGIPVYCVAVVFFCRKAENNPGTHLLVLSLRTLGVILVHGFSYYRVHKMFHSSPDLYKYHRFHHRFNTHVPPVSANAVTGVEYLLGYVFPFALAALLVKPRPLELKAAVLIISTCNLLIHTPRLEQLSENISPAFSSTHRHIEHHKKLSVNFAAPTFNVDWFVEQINRFFYGA